jgi:hypothetical protein
MVLTGELNEKLKISIERAIPKILKEITDPLPTGDAGLYPGL